MKLKADSFTLKLIAIICMTIDHIAELFVPDTTLLYFFMRMTGAVTFPVMAYMISEGYRKTRNLKKYKLRLACFSVISMLPFAIAFGRDTYGLNVGFTLLSGLFAIECYNKAEKAWLKWFLITVISVVSFNFDWGFIGTWMILMLYLAKDNKKKILFSLFIGVILFVVKNQLWIFLEYGRFISMKALLNSWAFLRHIGFIAAAMVIFMYNGEQKICIKHLFYIYYPLHLTVLGLIARLV